jgi:hypothetical protein
VYSLNSIDPSKTIDNRQQNLLRRCLSMMLPPPPIISKLTVPEIEVNEVLLLKLKCDRISIGNNGSFIIGRFWNS